MCFSIGIPHQIPQLCIGCFITSHKNVCIPSQPNLGKTSGNSANDIHVDYKSRATTLADDITMEAFHYCVETWKLCKTRLHKWGSLLLVSHHDIVFELENAIRINRSITPTKEQKD